MLRLRRPLICRFRPPGLRQTVEPAGVGTFPGWLSLAVAPASKGLIPQPVSMSGLQCIAGLEDASSEPGRCECPADDWWRRLMSRAIARLPRWTRLRRWIARPGGI